MIHCGSKELKESYNLLEARTVSTSDVCQMYVGWFLVRLARNWRYTPIGIRMVNKANQQNAIRTTVTYTQRKRLKNIDCFKFRKLWKIWPFFDIVRTRSFLRDLELNNTIAQTVIYLVITHLQLLWISEYYYNLLPRNEFVDSFSSQGRQDGITIKQANIALSSIFGIFAVVQT